MDDLSTNLLNKSIGFSWISRLLRLEVRKNHFVHLSGKLPPVKIAVLFTIS